MTHSGTLYEIITRAAGEKRPAWRDAARFAADRLGTQLAARIEWAEQPLEQCGQIGILAGTDTFLTLRFEESEPGAAMLQVQVSCPADPACAGPAWDTVHDRGDLLAVLDGDPSDDPWCEGCNPL